MELLLLESVPPEEPLLDGLLTIFDFAIAMELENDFEKLCMLSALCEGDVYHWGGGTCNASNFLAHLSNIPKASA